MNRNYKYLSLPTTAVTYLGWEGEKQEVMIEERMGDAFLQRNKKE